MLTALRLLQVAALQSRRHNPGIRLRVQAAQDGSGGGSSDDPLMPSDAPEQESLVRIAQPSPAPVQLSCLLHPCRCQFTRDICALLSHLSGEMGGILGCDATRRTPCRGSRMLRAARRARACSGPRA